MPSPIESADFLPPDSGMAMETRALHAGTKVNKTAALTPPIFQTTTFKLENAARGAELTHAVAPTEFYTRWGNPTTRQVEVTVASLERAEAAVAFASGMGAISALFQTVLDRGDHLVVPQALYSGSVELSRQLVQTMGIEVSAVDFGRLADLEAALRSRTRLIFLETPTNPTLAVYDLEAIARIGKKRGILTAVDNTFASPVNQNPLAHGIDAVMHSATKYLGGHSDVTGGILCGARSLMERCWSRLKLQGSSLSPFEAWLLLRGLKTLCLRVRQQSQNALELARFLQSRPDVERVHYPGLESHPDHALAKRQMRDFGGMLSFELRGGAARARRFVESLDLVQLAVSLGGVESIIQHPASMTHGMLSDEELKKGGIAPGLLRLSVGVENAADLELDLDQALSRSGA
jgi:cystathionine beta-lyase/cystathionine gamma-synthase